jgi:hypothetical protein
LAFWLNVEQIQSSGATLFQLHGAKTGDAKPFELRIKDDVTEVDTATLSLHIQPAVQPVITASIEKNERVHIAVVLEFGQPAKLYVNGELGK